MASNFFPEEARLSLEVCYFPPRRGVRETRCFSRVAHLLIVSIRRVRFLLRNHCRVQTSPICVSAFVPFSVSCAGNSALGHDRCVLRLKENSSKCHPHSCTYIVTSVLWFCVFLPIPLFGHDLRMLMQVCLVVDLFLCRSLLVTLDTGTWLSG